MQVTFKNFINLDEQEINKVLQWRNSERIRKNMITQNIIDTDSHKKWISNLSNKKDCRYYLVSIDKKNVGAAYYTGIDYKNRIAEWGYYIGEDSFGYGTLIQFLLMEHYFKESGFESLYCRVLETNIKVYNNHINHFGFNKDDNYSGNIVLNNQNIKILGLSISKTEWKNKTSKINEMINKLFKEVEVTFLD